MHGVMLLKSSTALLLRLQHGTQACHANHRSHTHTLSHCVQTCARLLAHLPHGAVSRGVGRRRGRAAQAKAARAAKCPKPAALLRGRAKAAPLRCSSAKPSARLRRRSKPSAHLGSLPEGGPARRTPAERRKAAAAAAEAAECLRGRVGCSRHAKPWRRWRAESWRGRRAKARRRGRAKAGGGGRAKARGGRLAKCWTRRLPKPWNCSERSRCKSWRLCNILH